MIKKNQGKLNFINYLSDFLVFFTSYFFASYIRFGIYNGELTLEEAWSGRYVFLIFLFSIFMVMMFYIFNIYKPQRKRRIRDEAADIIIYLLFGIILGSSGLYFTKSDVFSRLTIAMYYGFCVFFLVLKRIILKRYLFKMREQGYNQKHIVVIGNGILAKEYIEEVKANKEFGYSIDGYVSKFEKEELGKSLGSYEELDSILSTYDVDELIVALEPHETHFIKKIIEISEKQGVRISIIPFYNAYIPSHPTIEEIGNCKLINIRTTPFDNILNSFIKRTSDIFISLIGIILTSPLLLFISIGILLTCGKGPIIFRQTRVGLNKKIFTMYKFRTMKQNDYEDSGWSTKDDSRKTIFGSFLRKFSLDELPQLFNILKGEMSLIGPRPEIPYYVEKFKEDIPMYMIRHLVRPGMTGWAQVNGYRGDTSIQKRIEYDI